MRKTVALIESLDTKGEEALYAKGVLEENGFGALVVDSSTRGLRNGGADVTPEQVLERAGVPLARFESCGKSERIELMSDALAATLPALYRDGRFDAVVADFDGDGLPELGNITPFHGDTLELYHLDEQGRYQKTWQMPYPMGMLHATWLGSLRGRPAWFVGCRKGVRQTIALYWENGAYRTEMIDDQAGAANALQLDERTIVCTNYATNEVVMYTME